MGIVEVAIEAEAKVEAAVVSPVWNSIFTAELEDKEKEMNTAGKSTTFANCKTTRKH